MWEWRRGMIQDFFTWPRVTTILLLSTRLLLLLCTRLPSPVFLFYKFYPWIRYFLELFFIRLLILLFQYKIFCQIRVSFFMFWAHEINFSSVLLLLLYTWQHRTDMDLMGPKYEKIINYVEKERWVVWWQKYQSRQVRGECGVLDVRWKGWGEREGGEGAGGGWRETGSGFL